LQRYIKIFYQKVKINFFIRKVLCIFAEIKYETMEAKELRISNLVHLIADVHENEPDLLIWELEDYEFYENKMEYIKPIPLTEEWLLKFGFEVDYGCIILSNKRGVITIEEDLAEISSTINHDGFMAPCKYVHQLQNLYFALTGEELTIK